jgi:hypothetical protein
MKRPMIRALFVLAPLLITVIPSKAEARRRGGLFFFLITTGETIKHVRDIPSDVLAKVRKAYEKPNGRFKIGYSHSRFGLFWIDIWTWGGTYCIYEGNAREKITAAEAANVLKIEEGALPKPFFYSFPPGLMAILAVGGFMIFRAVRSNKEDEALGQEIETLLADSRYERALEVFNDALPDDGDGDPTAAFEAAVDDLVAQGVNRNRAERKLQLLIAFIAQAQAEE